MFYPIHNYHKANEVLYVLAAVEESGGGPVSKIALQKLLYLASALAPIKEVVLEFLHFIYQKRGPYSKDIQNAVDHLVALGVVDVVSFKRQGRAAFANGNLLGRTKHIY